MAQPLRGGAWVSIFTAVALAGAPAGLRAADTTGAHLDASDGSESAAAGGESPSAAPGSPGTADPEQATPAISGSVAGPTVDAAQARQAEADLAGSPVTSGERDAPRRMEPLQAGAWWTLFATVGLATVGGVLGGLAEVQEDRAIRIASEYDPETGMQPLYEDRQEDYEQAIRRGEQLQWAAWGTLAASGVMAVVSGALFIAHARHRKSDERRARFAPGKLEVRF